MMGEEAQTRSQREKDRDIALVTAAYTPNTACITDISYILLFSEIQPAVHRSIAIAFPTSSKPYVNGNTGGFEK